MKFITKIKNWLIRKLGGYTEEEYEKAKKIAWETGADYQKSIDGVWRTTACRMGAKHNALEKTIRTVESYITIDNALGYTEDNVIAESRQQTYYQLGKAVYPYAKHFVTSDGKYICAVNVQEADDGR